jgi:hypothetical protein
MVYFRDEVYFNRLEWVANWDYHIQIETRILVQRSLRPNYLDEKFNRLASFLLMRYKMEI